jgi:hypothetical protein
MAQHKPRYGMDLVSIHAYPRQLVPEGHDDVCAICIEQYASDAKVLILNCTHLGHYECMETWLRLRNICPICRDEVNGPPLADV